MILVERESHVHFPQDTSALLKEDGMIAFVLPSDLLQVKYAEEIRCFLEEKFERLEIFNLSLSDFPGIDQQTMLLFGYKKSKSIGTYFYEVIDYSSAKVKQISSNGLMVCQHKWTHYNLSHDEIVLLNSINRKLPRVSEFVTSTAGIVTGANKFFILNEGNVLENGASSYALPVLQKSNLVNRCVDFTKKDFDRIGRLNRPSYLLDLRKKRRNRKLDLYIEDGVAQGLPDRHKCSMRDNWYEVPNIGVQPSAFFFKRCHLFPKVIRNVANVFVTDSAYKITTKKQVDLRSFIRSFYSGITFIYSELLGRKYGGGVLELSPNEFRSLPIFYSERSPGEYREFTNEMKFDHLRLDLLFPPELVQFLDLTEDEVKMVKGIYFKLLSARIGQFEVREGASAQNQVVDSLSAWA